MLRHSPSSGTWRGILPLVLAQLVASCDSTAPPPDPQVILVTTTTGDDVDPDGYTYSVDGGPAQTVPSNASGLVVTVAPGTRSISFSGVAGNCQAVTASPIVVTLAGGESSQVTFSVTCEPRLRIVATTTGEDVDVAFLAAVDASSWRLLLPNAQLAVPNVTPGTRELRIAGVAPNCTLTGPSQRPILVPADAITTIQLAVTCSATTRRILFGSTRDGGYDLYAMNADGSSTVRLTDGSRPALHGRWSPGADRIAYHSAIGLTSTGATGFDIYVMNADGTGSTALTSDGAAGVSNLYPDWSPDGTKILWEKGAQIWVMDANGSNARQVRAGYRPRWSPDGNRIAFHDGHAVWVMGADGSGARIIQAVNNYYSAYPAWSPDGTKILFASPRDGAFNDIYVMNADGTGVVRLTQSPAGVMNEDFDWSPDGRRIAWRTNRDGGNPEIYVMNADGSNPTRVAPNVWDEFGPAWRP